MNQFRQQLRHYAQHNPKASAAALVFSTLSTCAALVVIINVRDSRDYARRPRSDNESITPREAQLAAMIENAKRSSWRENLRNAADAHERFMIPVRDADEGREPPEYVKRINERSKEILKDETEKERRLKESENDPTNTKFWR